MEQNLHETCGTVPACYQAVLSECFKDSVNASRTQRMLGAFFFPFFNYSFIQPGVEFADRPVDTVVRAVTGEYTEECRE